MLVPNSAPEFWFPDRLSYPNSWAGHIPFAFWLIAQAKPRVLIELGTHSGNSYLAFCQAVKTVGCSTACFAVDTWLGDPHAGSYSDQIFQDLNDYHQPRYGGFSRLLRMTFDEAVDKFVDGTVDLLHIDGLHTYEAVKHDFETWLPKLSNRALVLFHDVNVRKEDFGVWKLWAELTPRYPHFTFLHSNGLGVLAVGAEQPEAIQTLLAAAHHPEECCRICYHFARLGEPLAQKIDFEQLQYAWLKAADDISRYQTSIQHHTAELEQLHQQLTQTQQELTQAQAQVTEAGEDADRLQQDYQALQLQYQTTRQALQQAQLEADATHTRWQRQFQQVEALYHRTRDRHQQDTAALHSAQQQLIQLQQELDRRRIQLDAQQRSLAGRVQRVTRKLNQVSRRLKRSSLAVPVKFLTTAAGLRSGSWRAYQTIRRDYQLLQASLLFDAEYYLAQRADLATANIDPIDHFLRYGATVQLSPQPLFDIGYYCERYPDVRQAGLNPLVHYILYGAQEGRSPHPLFDVDYYWSQWDEKGDRQTNSPLLHYLTLGWRQNPACSPTPLFDAAHYLRAYPHLANAAEPPLAHYLKYGGLEQLSPHPLFDPAYYVSQYPELRETAQNPLCHYVMQGEAAGAKPHPLIDMAYYRQHYADLHAASTNLFAHYLQYGWGEHRSPHPLFDAGYYAVTNPDLDSTMDLLIHYLIFGSREGRNPHPYFDTRYYLNQNYDVALRGMNPLVHFSLEGVHELRKPHPDVDLAAHKARVPHLEGVEVFQDCVQHLYRPQVNDGADPNQLVYPPRLARFGLTENTTFDYFLDRNEAEIFSDQIIHQSIGIYVSSLGNGFMYDLAHAFQCGFLDLGCSTVQLLDETAEFQAGLDWHFIVSPHEFFILGEGVQRQRQIPPNTIMFNTEQPQTPWFKIALPFLQQARYVVDINFANAQRLKKMGLDAAYLPIGYSSSYMAHMADQAILNQSIFASLSAAEKAPVAKPLALAERPIDILFIGTMSGRRSVFFAENAERFANYRCFFYLPGAAVPLRRNHDRTVSPGAMAAMAQRAKIVLNIHRDRECYFEWHRLVQHGILQKSLVITEITEPAPLLSPNVDYVECPTAEIVDACEFYLQNLDLAEMICDQGYQQVTQQLNLKDILAALMYRCVAMGGTE